MNRRGISVIGVGALVAVLAVAADARAQSASLYGNPAQRRQPLTLANTSWTYQAVEPPHEIKLNDLVTVIVNYEAQVFSEGSMDRRKKADFKAVLKDWVILKNWAVFPDPQSKGDPTLSGSFDNKLRSQAELESRDGMRFKISCSVVDIRPNGLLVLEGRRSIRNNDEMWELSLIGSVRPEDVLPNNTVLSEKVASLRIHKREAGHVRDGYRRGWMLRWLDTYQPF
jgi:flagellar L-ring protein precursor FlgH